MALTMLLALALPLAGFSEPISWPAFADPATWPHLAGADRGSFTLSVEGATALIRVSLAGETIERSLPAANLPSIFPFAGRSQLGVPFGRFAPPAPIYPFQGIGWYLWDGRPAPIVAPGKAVVSASQAQPPFGWMVELDHGSGLRTRYTLFRDGSSGLPAGAAVDAGGKIADLGAGFLDDTPYIHFEVLLEVAEGAFLALDPAPFVFRKEEGRRVSFATCVLNAAVRAGDPEALGRLLALGLDPNGIASDRSIPLEWAVLEGNADMVRLLVAAGADPLAATARNSGTVTEGYGRTIVNTGPTIVQLVELLGDAELEAALAKP